jgi:hypothetical protein
MRNSTGPRLDAPDYGNGTFRAALRLYVRRDTLEVSMNGLIYLVGLVVVILAVLSFFGLR